MHALIISTFEACKGDFFLMQRDLLGLQWEYPLEVLHPSYWKLCFP